MITPSFSCSQNSSSVIISIYCPSVRASEADIDVDTTVLTVHINPYFLRLHFSHSLLEDDDSSARYEPTSGYLTVTLTKEVKGQEFKDLALLGKLLTPPASGLEKLIEVISTQENQGSEELASGLENLSIGNEDITKVAENDWHAQQDVSNHLPTLRLSNRGNYGFLEMHSGYFLHVAHTDNEVNELGADAETCPIEDRRRRRLQHEESKWDEEHYIADYLDDEYILELCRWENPQIAAETEFVFTDDENAAMLRLPRKEYLATASQTHQLYLTLLSLLFSYSYETRTTQLDPTPESAWTICALTPVFSGLDLPPYSSVDPTSIIEPKPGKFLEPELASVFTASYRRSLAFPLYRSWELAEACRQDVGQILSKGSPMVTRCLMNMKYILDHHEVYYVYSKIWVDDFCVWAQARTQSGILHDLGNAVRTLHMEKSMMGWDLEELESVALDGSRSSDSDDE